MRIIIRGQAYLVNQNKNQKFWDYINSGAWEKETFDAIDSFIEKDGIAIDIGAWAGPISLYLAKNCKNVFSIEPDPFIFPDLANNCDLNPTLSVRPFNEAISDKTERTNLNARKNYGESSSSLLSRAYDELNSEMISTTTLEDFIKANSIGSVSFIKIDTEGSEFIFLKTWSKILNETKYPTLLISFHINQLEESILLKKYKFKLLAKLLLKISRRFSFLIPKKEIINELREIDSVLSKYKNCYCLSGQRINFSDLSNNPKSIKNNSFIFSNKAWN